MNEMELSKFKKKVFLKYNIQRYM